MNIALPVEAEIPSLKALHVVTDSQRHRLLCMLIRDPLTAAQVSKKLKITRTRVYYHLDLLVKHGFIEVVGEARVGSRIERTYRARAQHFVVDPRLLAGRGARSQINDARARQLESAAQDLRASDRRTVTRKDGADVLVTRQFLRLSPASTLELRRTLGEIAKEYGSRGEEGEPYEMIIALFSNESEGS